MGVHVSFGFGEFRLILRAAEGHTTGGGTDDTSLTEAVIKDDKGTVLRRQIFTDALALAERLCPGILSQDREGGEYLGSYPTLTAYMRAMLEPELTPACTWILNHLDYEAVQRRWESDGSRLEVQKGHVYRFAAPALGPPGPVHPEMMSAPAGHGGHRHALSKTCMIMLC